LCYKRHCKLAATIISFFMGLTVLLQQRLGTNVLSISDLWFQLLYLVALQNTAADLSMIDYRSCCLHYLLTIKMLNPIQHTSSTNMLF
ncbi:MAG: hypothetical protein M3M88_00295, partial [Thermoproteota archaeon]|nr:hypothetical protein [Thermoproteota archaeon]